MVAPAGIIAEPLDLLRTLISSLPKWQSWAGITYEKRIHLNENRLMVEDSASGSPLWINAELQMPFCIIWMPELVINPYRCLRAYSLMLMIQGKATDRQNHNESANTYATDVGVFLTELEDQIRTADANVGNFSAISMASAPTRVGLDESQPNHDFWTSAFKLEAPN